MEIICRGRRGGKTLEALKYMQSHPNVKLVVSNESEKSNVIKMLKTYPFSLSDQISEDKIVVWTPDFYCGNHNSYIIDNIEFIVRLMEKSNPEHFYKSILWVEYSNKIEGFTYTKED